MKRLPILQVEDDEHDVFFLAHAFKQAEITNPIQVVYDGKEALDYLSRAGNLPQRSRYPLPCLIILDLKLPRITGMEMLAWLRQESGLPPIPVIVFSSSAHRNDVERAFALGANAFVAKPGSVVERVRFAKAVKEFWLHFNEVPEYLMHSIQ
ncbi:MAG TPA: response regulator [Verrucomicrobiae bacterium]|nr:response regulator [Verrucomicrobiae bacterium]